MVGMEIRWQVRNDNGLPHKISFLYTNMLNIFTHYKEHQYHEVRMGPPFTITSYGKTLTDIFLNCMFLNASIIAGFTLVTMVMHV